MNKLCTTAKRLDTLFHIISVFLKIGFVCAIVGLAIIGACFLFDLDPDSIGSGYASLSIGALELEVAENCAPNQKTVLIYVAAELVLAMIVTFICIHSVKCIRFILQPMAEGSPFQSSISDKLKTLAKHSLFLGIAVNLMQIISTALWIGGFDLHNLLISEKITHVNFNFSIDLTFLLAAAILLLLSYIFRYGEQLQQLSDETL